MDSLQNLQQSRQRRHNAASLQQLLQIQIDMLIETKAREEVLTRTMHSHIQEFEENKELLENSIVQLKARNNELEQQLKHESIQQLQSEKEIETTGQMKKMLVEHFEVLKEQFKISDDSAKQMEQEYKLQIVDYQTESAQLQEYIAKEDKNLLDLQELIQRGAIQFRNEIEEKMNDLKILKGIQIQTTNEINEVIKKTDDLKAEINTNEGVLAQQNLQEAFMCKRLNDINIADLEMQLENNQDQYAKSLEMLNGDMESSAEILKNYEQQEITLQEELNKENNLALEYELTQAKLEDEHLILLSTVKNLTEEKRIADVESQNISENLHAELDQNNLKLEKINNVVNQILLNKTEKLNILHIEQDNIKVLQARVVKAESVTKELTNTNKATKLKLNALKEREIILKSNIENSKSSLLELKQQHLNDKVSKMQKLSELDENLRKNQNIFECIKNKSVRKIKEITDELTAYKMKQENVYEENAQNYNKKLQELENRLIGKKNNLAASKEHIDELHKTIPHYEAMNAKLKKKYELKASSSFVNEIVTPKPTSTNTPMKPILKSPTRQVTSSKVVTFSKEPTKLVSYEAGNIPEKMLYTTRDNEFDHLLETFPKHFKSH